MSAFQNKVTKGVMWMVMVGLCSVTLACAQISSYTKGEQEDTSLSMDASSPESVQVVQPVVYEFPDLPLPPEMKRVKDRTMLVKTRTFQGGILVLKGRITGDSLVDFFSKKLPEHGWELVGSIRAKRSLLAFSKGESSHCLIQIYDEPMGFQTEVQIWLTEPLGQDEIR